MVRLQRAQGPQSLAAVEAGQQYALQARHHVVPGDRVGLAALAARLGPDLGGRVEPQLFEGAGTVDRLELESAAAAGQVGSHQVIARHGKLQARGIGRVEHLEHVADGVGRVDGGTVRLDRRQVDRARVAVRQGVLDIGHDRAEGHAIAVVQGIEVQAAVELQNTGAGRGTLRGIDVAQAERGRGAAARYLLHAQVRRARGAIGKHDLVAVGAGRDTDAGAVDRREHVVHALRRRQINGGRLAGVVGNADLAKTDPGAAVEPTQLRALVDVGPVAKAQRARPQRRGTAANRRTEPLLVLRHLQGGELIGTDGRRAGHCRAERAAAAASRPGGIGGVLLQALGIVLHAQQQAGQRVEVGLLGLQRGIGIGEIGNRLLVDGHQLRHRAGNIDTGD